MKMERIKTKPEFDPIVAVRQIWRAKVVLCLFTTVCVAVAWLFLTYVKTPKFTSEASIAFVPSTAMMQRHDTSRIRDLGAAFTTNTEMGVLSSRDLLGALVLDLNLQTDPELLGEDRASLDTAVDGLRRMLEVKNTRFSFIVTATATSSDPQKSQRIVNGLVDLYMRRQLGDQIDAQTDQLALLTSKGLEIKRDLDQARARVQAAHHSSTTATPKEVDRLTAKLRDIRARRADLEKQLPSADEKVHLIASLNSNPQDKTPKFVKVAGRLSALRQSEQSLAQKHRDLMDGYTQLQDAQSEVAVLEALYQSFSLRIKQASAEQGLSLTQSRILSYGVLGKRTGLSAFMVLAIVAFAALMLGIYVNLVINAAKFRQIR